MCGICGVFDFRGDPVDRELIEKMANAIAHRGPDGDGHFVRGRIGLGHRRLSIIDIEGGAQPISDATGDVVVIFNGEIYNFVELRKELEAYGHEFRTRSDTEVILHGYAQWGVDCVTRFNGMFAFALWDESRQQLFLARDHLGVKPLYYARVGHRFLFGSEIKALIVSPECPRSVNIQSLAQLFTLRYVPSPNTMFDGIHKIPPGHRMLVDASGVRLERYWSCTPRLQSCIREGEWIEQYQALLQDVVRLQMRSDVPVGLFLSSGIDSCALLALMRQNTSGAIQTFTIGFEGGERSNETQDARATASLFGADHHEMMVTPQDYQTYYDRYLWDLEEPVGNETAAAFYFVSLIASRNVKVALTGQGADEPWAGYHRYIGVKLSEVYARLPRFLTDRTLRPLVEKVSRNERLRRGVASLSERDPLTRLVNIYSFYSPAMKRRLFLPWLQAEVSTEGAEARAALQRIFSDVQGLDPVTQALYVDTRSNLPDDLLMVGDKTSMANSLEARVPYLDHRLVELVEQMPPGLKLKGFTGKYLHKKALAKWVPEDVVHRKKKGFANPIDEWLRGRMKSYVTDCLLAEGAAVSRYFDQGYIRQLVADHESNKQNHLRHLYLLISFELWHKRFIDA
jgi:asparagine synthase (glutamine-hydrolysing)